MRGQIDKYSWKSVGSSYLPSDINSAHLWAQLEMAEEINKDRLASWQRYMDGLSPLEQSGRVQLPVIPRECEHNAHMFYIKTKDITERTALIAYLKERGIGAVFHYVPLHTAPAGVKYGRFHGEDKYTTKESERLLRLPMYYGLTKEDTDKVIEGVKEFCCAR